MANSPDWKDLPPELLLKVATSCSGVQNQMRGVCQSWKTGLEACSTQLTIFGSALPTDLGARFTALSTLDLKGCTPGMTPRGLRSLRSLPSLAVLAMEMSAADITDASMAALLNLRLTRLDFELAGERSLFTDTHLTRLAGKSIQSMGAVDMARNPDLGLWRADYLS